MAIGIYPLTLSCIESLFENVVLPEEEGPANKTILTSFL